MNDVFILGSGFSNAISDNKLPTLNSLTKGLEAMIKDRDEKPFSNLILEWIDKIGYDNFEDLLTVLYQDFPWKTSQESHLQYSLYEYLSKLIAKYFEDCQEEAPTIKNKKAIEAINPGETIPLEFLDPTLKNFICRLHKEETKLITFNYDAVFEDISRIIIDKCILYDKGKNKDEQKRISCDHFYLMALMRLHKLQITHHDLFREYIPTFTLSKLHGSINWYHYGRNSNQIFLESGYFREVQEVSKKALVPVIIPPVYDKTGFLNIAPIRWIWVRAREHLSKADRLFIIGYSLPESDLTVRLMLKNNINASTQIYVIDSNTDTSENKFKLQIKYENLLGKVNQINCDYIKEENAISDFMGTYGDYKI
jgi:hypothetical protein